MGLYWKETEILPGMLLEVDHLHPEVFNSAGCPVVIMWEILSFETRKTDEAYIDHSTGRKYTMKKVMKSRRLQKKINRIELLQIPACSDFMVVQEYHDGEIMKKRCFALDMLGTVRSIKVLK